MRERLRATPDAFLVHRNDATAAKFRQTLPQLSAEIDAYYEPVARFGVYRVLRRRPAS